MPKWHRNHHTASGSITHAHFPFMFSRGQEFSQIGPYENLSLKCSVLVHSIVFSTQTDCLSFVYLQVRIFLSVCLLDFCPDGRPISMTCFPHAVVKLCLHWKQLKGTLSIYRFWVCLLWNYYSINVLKVFKVSWSVEMG